MHQVRPEVPKRRLGLAYRLRKQLEAERSRRLETEQQKRHNLTGRLKENEEVIHHQIPFVPAYAESEHLPEEVTATRTRRQTREERLRKKREAERARRARRKSVPELYRQDKEKEKMRYLRRKKLGRIKTARNLTPRERRLWRERQRENVRRFRERKRLALQKIRSSSRPSQDNLSDIASTPGHLTDHQDSPKGLAAIENESLSPNYDGNGVSGDVNPEIPPFQEKERTPEAGLSGDIPCGPSGSDATVNFRCEVSPKILPLYEKERTPEASRSGDGTCGPSGSVATVNFRCEVNPKILPLQEKEAILESGRSGIHPCGPTGSVQMVNNVSCEVNPKIRVLQEKESTPEASRSGDGHCGPSGSVATVNVRCEVNPKILPLLEKEAILESGRSGIHPCGPTGSVQMVNVSCEVNPKTLPLHEKQRTPEASRSRVSPCGPSGSVATVNSSPKNLPLHKKEIILVARRSGGSPCGPSGSVATVNVRCEVNPKILPLHEEERPPEASRSGAHPDAPPGLVAVTTSGTTSTKLPRLMPNVIPTSHTEFKPRETPRDVQPETPATGPASPSFPVSSSITAGSWVAAMREQDWYPGIVEEVGDSTLTVMFMARSGRANFFWPRVRDLREIEQRALLYVLREPPEPQLRDGDIYQHMKISEWKYIDFLSKKL